MKRRAFISKAGIGLAAGAVAAPAIAQQSPTINWRLTSSFPKSLDTIFGAADMISKRVAEVTEGKFQIRVFAAGEIVPAFSAVDAVQNGTVECCHTAPYYFIGKDPAFAIGTAIPFGLNGRMQNAWRYYGGGNEAMAALYKDYGMVGFPAGNTGAQMGGWFRKEIKSVADLKGLKFRVGGFAGQVLAKLGVVPQALPGGEIYQALERGTLDAAEWVGPYDDEKLGFNKVAKYYYYPGWWEGGPELSLFVNDKKWAELPKHYQAALESACAEANVHMQAKYDALNPGALRKLIAGGTQLRAFPPAVIEACQKAAAELYAETSVKSAHFKRIYEGWAKFRADQYLWWQVAENTYDNIMVRQMRGAGGGGAPKAAPKAAPAKKG